MEVKQKLLGHGQLGHCYSPTNYNLLEGDKQMGACLVFVVSWLAV